MGGLYDAVAGAGDFLGGDVDETIGRTFDDEPGDGLEEAAFGEDGKVVDFTMVPTIGPALESIGRQFDDDPGGGFVDETADTAEEAANDAGNAVGGAVWDSLRSSPALQAITLLVVIVALGQLFDVQLGGGSSA